MDSLKIYTHSDLDIFINRRTGEEKLGEKVQLVTNLDGLQLSPAKFVLLGIPEDIGVRANHGIGGAKTAWHAALKVFLNFQSNSFLTGAELIVLGHFEIEEPGAQDVMSLREKVAAIDELVKPVIAAIVAAGKIPVVIGGGHNNAYPILTGTANILGAMNVINIDAHADLRSTGEGRHSGNGFSKAHEQHLINDYRVFGLHETYANAKLADFMATNRFKALYFEDYLKSTQTISQSWNKFTAGIKQPCGLEIDLDSIANVLSSAMSPSGFTVNEIRQILLSNNIRFRYLHLCEGAVEMADGRKDPATGKTMACLMADFIKNQHLI